MANYDTWRNTARTWSGATAYYESNTFLYIIEAMILYKNEQKQRSCVVDHTELPYMPRRTKYLGQAPARPSYWQVYKVDRETFIIEEKYKRKTFKECKELAEHYVAEDKLLDLLTHQ